MRNLKSLMLSTLVFGSSAVALAAGPIGAGTTTGGQSQFTNYTASVLIYGLLAAALVIALLVGGFLILNLGLLSKRPDDRIGGKDPSDVEVLSETVWPEEAKPMAKLPAEESAGEIARTKDPFKRFNKSA